MSALTVPVHVKLELTWDGDKSSVAVVENVPAGWTVGRLSHGAKSAGNEIRWEIAPWTSPGVTLEYTATPPADAGVLPIAFAGATYAVDAGLPSRIEDTRLARAGTAPFQEGVFPGPDYRGCQDAHILLVDNEPHALRSNNTGACAHIEEGNMRDKGAGPDRNADHKKILIRFDLSSLAPTFRIERAKLFLYAFGERLFVRRNEHTIYAARVLKPWGEGQATHHDGRGYQTRQGDVTGHSAQHGLAAWEKPGAIGRSDVDDAESSATAGANWPEWVTLDVTESVRYFLANPAENFGWKISQDPLRGIAAAATSYALGAYMFVSREAITENYRPTLVLAPEEP